MGYGTFDSSTYRAYSATTTLRSDGSAKTAREVFTSTSIKEALDPRKITMRESVDSADNPNSRAIIMALDVTGSMGFIAHELAKTKLGTLMEGILDTKPIADPHLMFMALGDAACDSAPLQVSQFEADIRIAQQLTDIYLEGRGGGNDTESYDLPWYFAATRTTIDCFNKRGQKGYLFTFGDEMPPAGLSQTQLERVFGSSVQSGYTAAELLKMAKEKYEVFHVIVEQGNYARGNVRKVAQGWYDLMGNRALLLSDYNYLPEVVLAAIRVNEGEDPETVIESFTECADVVRHALFGNNPQTL